MMTLTSKHIRLRHLRCFIAMSEYADVEKAAQVLRTTQAIVSRSLRELEIEVGRSLFSRTVDGVKLTAAGVSYRNHISANSPKRGRSFAGRQAAKLPLGMLAGVANSLAPRATAVFRETTKDVNLQWMCADPQQLIDALRIGKIDLIIGREVNLEHCPDLMFEALYPERLVFIVPAQHPLSRAGTVTLQQVNGELVLVPVANTVARRDMDQFLHAHAKSGFVETIETGSIDFIRSFLADNSAVACVAESAVRTDLDAGTFVKLPLHGDELKSCVGITKLADKNLPPAAESFAAALRHAAQQFA